MHANPPLSLNPEGRLPGLIVVDHAGRSVPPELADLGLSAEQRETHHFVDIGAAELARCIALRLDVPIVLCDVSRLVIDVNRWIADPSSIPTHIEGQPIPGNIAMSEAERRQRQSAVLWPYHRLVDEIWMKQTARHARPFFLALHTCTRFADGMRRPWDGGTIRHSDRFLSDALIASLGKEPGLTIGDNLPYNGLEGIYCVDRHTYGSGLPACGFEVTNDQLETRAGIETWAARLVRALETVITPELAS